MTREQALRHITRVCGPGWRRLVEHVYDRLPVGCTVEQVYQKWGVLRFDLSSANSSAEQLIAEVEELSTDVCQICGRRGAGEVIVNDWVETLCPQPTCFVQASKLNF